ncbi:MAG: hypothetical protein ACK5LJ_08195 [Paracoccus sp. (in: a-proteobacteria)]
MTASNDLPKTQLCDSVLVNYQGSTRQIKTQNLAQLLGDGGSGSGSPFLAEQALRIAADREGGTLTLVNVGGTGDAITADLAPALIDTGIAAIGANSRIAFVASAANTVDEPTLTVAGSTLRIRTSAGAALLPGAIVAGRAYLLQRVGDFWLIMNEVSLSDLQSAAVAEAAARAAYVDAELARFDLVLAASPWPGDYLIPIVSDASGRPVSGLDLRTLTIWERSASTEEVAVDPDWITSPWPGDYLSVNLIDGSGRAMAGFDLRDGVFWQRGGASSGSGGVAPADPINPQALGAREVGGVIQYFSNQWAGRLWSFEERDGAVIAETPSLAVSVAAFGGGTTAVLGGENCWCLHLGDFAIR